MQKRRGWPDLREGEIDSHSTELKFEDHSPGFPIMVIERAVEMQEGPICFYCWIDGSQSALIKLSLQCCRIPTPPDNCKGNRGFKLYVQKLAL